VAGANERVITVQSGGAELHGVLHTPADPVGGVVLCHPFAEEKKCAHRALVDLARACAGVGWASLSFDMRGCGDSPGTFGEQDLVGWREDITAAAQLLGRETGGARIGLAGLRLGATLAAQVAGDPDGIACLVMLEPVVDGARYIKDNMRRSIIKAMMTKRDGGEAFDATSMAGGEGAVDFDGYTVSAAMQEQIKAVNLVQSPSDFAGPTLVVNLSSGDEPTEEMQSLASACKQAVAVAVKQEPIWQRIGLMDASPTVEAVTGWLQQL